MLRLGYSERFWRKYQFYFAYCEAAFDARYIHDYHVVWAKDSAVAMRDGQVGWGWDSWDDESTAWVSARLHASLTSRTDDSEGMLGRRARLALQAAWPAAPSQTQPLDDASLNIYASGAIVQDVWTQALASAWFFLAGIAAGRAPVMALVPASSAGFVALLMGIARTHAGLSPASAVRVREGCPRG